MSARQRVHLAWPLVFGIVACCTDAEHQSAVPAWEVSEQGWERFVLGGAHVGLFVPLAVRPMVEHRIDATLCSLVDSTEHGVLRTTLLLTNAADLGSHAPHGAELRDSVIGGCRTRAGVAAVADTLWVQAVVGIPANRFARYCYITSVLVGDRAWGEKQLTTMIGSLVQVRFRRVRDGAEVW
jgi:hypothetical protein